MKRTEVWWVNFDPSVGGEIRKRRPAIIISINPSNAVLNRVQVVPISSQLEHIYISETAITSMANPEKQWRIRLQLSVKNVLTRKLGLFQMKTCSE
jgi:mRNA interferase MazF